MFFILSHLTIMQMCLVSPYYDLSVEFLLNNGGIIWYT